MATGGFESTSDEVFNFKCTAYAKRNRNREAVKYCVECQGYCCQSCVEVHQDFPTLATHNLLDNSSFKSTGSTDGLPAIPTERCAVHETKIIDMYCQSHDDVGCTTCMALKHRECSAIKSISEDIDVLYKKTEVVKILHKLKSIQISLEAFKKRSWAQINSLQKSKSEAIQEIKKFRENLEKILDDMEKQSIRELENEINKIESAMKDEIKAKEKDDDTFKKVISDLHNAEGNIAQEFVSSKLAMKMVQKYVDQVKYIEETSNVSFSADKGIVNLLKQKETFGVITKEADREPRKNLYTIKSKRKINVKTNDDTSTCCIYGSCVTNDNLLLLADNGNGKIKMVDMKWAAVIEQFNLPDSPWDVCCASNNEAAVSLNNNSVQFVSLDSPMRLTRQLQMNHTCFKIGYKDGKLFITDNGKSLFIHNILGDFLQKISKDNFGSDTFVQCRGISFNDNGDMINVGCFMNGLVLFSLQGKHINTSLNKNLVGVVDLCSDHRGNMFVCGHTSNNIMQFSQESLYSIGTVAKQSDGLYGPLSVSFSLHKCTLIVTNYNDDNVILYELK